MPISTTRAFAGVYDPRPTGELRNRLTACLEPDGPAHEDADGPLALAWTHPGEPGRASSGSVSCLLDGHVYNLAEVAEAARVAPVPDAAAVLAGAYRALGAGLLPLLRGDFALCLWNRDEQTGLLARDQLGGRPLFVHRSGDRIAFASEARNLVRLLPSRPAPDEVSLAHWLAPGPIPEGRTFFAGIEALAPASYVKLSAGGIRTIEYWKPRYRRPARISGADAAEAVRSTLVRAVERRGGPADHTGVLLSGGIDSASVAGLAAAQSDRTQRPRRSYSATFPGHPEIDESELIRAVASHTGLDATCLEVGAGSVLAGALPYIDAWDAPPSSPNLFFLLPLLRRAAADGIRVLLDGEGGDAVFWHSPVLLGDRLRRGRLVSAWALAGRFPDYGAPTTWRDRQSRIRAWRRSVPAVRPPAPAWLGERSTELLAAPSPRPDEGAPAWWNYLVDGVMGPGSRLLHDISRRHGALAGIEPRHPLLDLDLVELALSLPPELAFDRRYNRPLLRHAVAGLVPEPVRERPYKSRFDPVFAEGMLSDRPAIERLLLDQGAEIGAFVDRARLRERLEAPPADAHGLRAWCVELWHLSTLECWLRRQAGREAVPGGSALSAGAARDEFALL